MKARWKKSHSIPSWVSALGGRSWTAAQRAEFRIPSASAGLVLSFSHCSPKCGWLHWNEFPRYLVKFCMILEMTPEPWDKKTYFIFLLTFGQKIFNLLIYFFEQILHSHGSKLKNYRGCAFVSWGCCNKAPPTGWLRATEISCLTAWRGELKSRWWLGSSFSGLGGGSVPGPPPGFGGFAGNLWGSLACRHVLPMSTFIFSRLSPCVCVYVCACVCVFFLLIRTTVTLD